MSFHLDNAQALLDAGRVREAAGAYLDMLAASPYDAALWEGATTAFMRRGLWGPARLLLEKSLGFCPDNPNLRAHYALALAEEWELTEAARQCRAVLEQDPRHPGALAAKISILMNAGYPDLTVAVCRAAEGKHPQLKKTLAFNEGFALLMTGKFEEGYARMAQAGHVNEPKESLPDWRGERDPGIHLVLYGEQGYGDMLQFIRFAKRAAQRVGKVTARIPAPLERLIRASMPELELSIYKPATAGDRGTSEADPLFDFPAECNRRCSFFNLPNVLKLGGETDAAAVPYLRAPEGLADFWKEKLAAIPCPRIGLSWAGSSQNGNNHNRSAPFGALAPLAEQFGKHLVLMQVGPERAQAENSGLFDAAPFLKDFADTAALMNEVDLMLTVCTAPAHLAGGMGRPCWTMLTFNADWRWFLGREDCPWYPQMRLFRQTAPRDWAGVVARIAPELQKFVDGDRIVLSPKLWNGGFLTRHPQAIALPETD